MNEQDKQKFFTKISKCPITGCWNWTGIRGGGGNGYGVFHVGGRNRFAHRVSLEIAGRPVPAGLVTDHVCRNTMCVNPDHLEAVTQSVNNLRSPLRSRPGRTNGLQKRTHCNHGHEFTPANTIIRKNGGWRQCRECSNMKRRVEWLRSQGLECPKWADRKNKNAVAARKDVPEVCPRSALDNQASGAR